MTITDAEIKAFAIEAGNAGDMATVKDCERALAGNARARRFVADMMAEADAMDDGDDIGEDFRPDGRFDGIQRNWMGEPC